jgi:hypothetical protein
MDLNDIISAAADEADDFLSSVTNKSEARTVILTWLSDNHPDLSPGDSARVTSGLIKLLDGEGFFDTRGGAGGDEWGIDADDRVGEA